MEQSERLKTYKEWSSNKMLIFNNPQVVWLIDYAIQLEVIALNQQAEIATLKQQLSNNLTGDES